MTRHRCVIEAGPEVIRRLCCGTGESAAASPTALDVIDDPVALVDGQPVAVTALWGTVLRSLACPNPPVEARSVLIICPSWWSASRVELVAAAGRTLVEGGENLAVVSRTTLLAADVVVEIAARLVALTVGGNTVAEPRIGAADGVAEAVGRRAVALTRADVSTVLIDSPDGVGGAAALAESIGERLRAAFVDADVQPVDDVRFARLATAEPPAEAEPSHPVPVGGSGRRPHRIPALMAGAVLLIAGVGLLGVPAGPDAPGRGETAEAPTVEAVFLVEGRVALQVPVRWPVRRVTTGSGSARVEVISPADAEVVLHVTQSPVADGTLAATAEAMKEAVQQANAAETAEVFVDFDPAGSSAGRPALTYREVRGTHDVDWVVLVDREVRIGIGCQHRRGDADAIRAVCDQAVSSARAVR